MVPIARFVPYTGTDDVTSFNSNGGGSECTDLVVSSASASAAAAARASEARTVSSTSPSDGRRKVPLQSHASGRSVADSHRTVTAFPAMKRRSTFLRQRSLWQRHVARPVRRFCSTLNENNWSLFLLSPTNPVRLLLARLVHWKYFERMVFLFVALSAVQLALDEPRKRTCDGVNGTCVATSYNDGEQGP